MPNVSMDGSTEAGQSRGARARFDRLLRPIRSFPSAQRLEDILYGYLIERSLDFARATATPPTPRNAALKSVQEVHDADRVLRSLRLRAYFDHPFKVWDGVRFLSVILHDHPPGSAVLDFGSGPHSNVLRWLELHGYRDLAAVDVVFPRPIRRGAIRYYEDDVHRTRFGDARFDCAFAQSIIEHAIDPKTFLREARRVLRPGGSLLVSTDFWPTKIDTSGITMYGVPWTIFSEPELRAFVHEAEAAGFRLCEPLDLSVGRPVLDLLGKRYTFAFIDFRVA